jgi:hypothetical protein
MLANYQEDVMAVISAVWSRKFAGFHRFSSGSMLRIGNLGSYFLVDIKLWEASSYEDSLFTNFDLRDFSLLSR